MTSTPIRIGVALTGSFCTHARVLAILADLRAAGYALTPILSHAAGTQDTRFGTAQALRGQLTALCGQPVIDTIPAAEPIGPRALFDLLLVAPCTGNTLAKLDCGIIDTPVTMAVKSHLRGEKPVVLAVSTNDALSGSAVHIGALLARRHYYFVPMRQDDPLHKPRSVVACMERIPETVQAALHGEQLQPILTS